MFNRLQFLMRRKKLPLESLEETVVQVERKHYEGFWKERQVASTKRQV